MIRAEPHAEVLVELIEYWEDIAESGVDSQAVIVPVPHRWGRTTVLSEFAGAVEGGNALGRLVRIDGSQAPDGRGLQTLWLGAQMLEQAQVRPSAKEFFGVGRPFGAAQQGIGVAGLFVAPAIAPGLLVASTAVGAVARLWDETAAGQQGQLARAAAAVARLSVSLPVAVVVDDADRLDPGLALLMIESLIERYNGQVLVCATASPGSRLLSELTSRAKYGLTQGRVQTVDVDPGMGYSARVGLVKQVLPGLSDGAAERIGQLTATFADVFEVASAERLTELAGSDDEPTVLAVIDQLVDALVRRAVPSFAAVIIGWAGGILQARQVERALAAVDGGPMGPDEHLVLNGSLVRLADPSAPDVRARIAILSFAQRRVLAEAILDEAELVCGATDSGILDRVVAARAAHRVSADATDKERLLPLQAVLTRDLEELGDFGPALAVARAALHGTGVVQMNSLREEARNTLEAAVIRLSTTTSAEGGDPMVQAAVARAVAGGASVRLEAQVWAAVNLLSQPGKREAGLRLADSIAVELEARDKLGPAADSWRILLAFHAGRAGDPQIAQQLLEPLLTGPGPDDRSDTARGVLFAVAGPGADTRLQILLLQADLDQTEEDAIEDRLRLHHTLAAGYARLGDYGHALPHAGQEYRLRADRQGPDHPDTLNTRESIATWIGRCGDLQGALRAFLELLPDQRRVLGADHPDTLTTRANVAALTGECGNARDALRLSCEVLPDQQRVLGPDDPDTLTTRCNIAIFTGKCGDARDALRQLRELLPDRQRVLGAVHPDTLATRSNIAALTGRCGNARDALSLSRELLPDQERVLGAVHPDTLYTRSRIASLTGQCGNAQEALRLSRELLLDRQRILGVDHPDTLATRNNTAAWTGECGDARGALLLFRELLPDEQRVLGPDHPDTLTIRDNIASCRTLRRCARSAAPVSGVASRQAAGPRRRPPRHACDPQ